MIQDFEKRYAAARRAVIARRYRRLNDRQREAVLCTEGPLLLLAGAGSGKTTVLINRVDNLLTFGKGSDTDFVPDWATAEDLAFLEGFPAEPSPEDWREARRLCAVDPAVPWSVIAITFTNKAAGELKERLGRMCGPAANDIWAATFHSACVRILRRDIERLDLGFTNNFTIYDSDDSRRVIKDILKDMSLDEKDFQPRSVLSIISNAKDEDQSPEEFSHRARSSHDWRMPRIAEIYAGYARRLREANALDFDDIILHAVHLLQKDEEVRTYYQRKFRYVLIDEYQDTNHLQYLLAALLAGGRKNICVVGDDDQSIYRFRGATIENILSFESEYKNARVIRLEQNYRSTGNILEAANAVIRNNRGRKGKNLWTEHGEGEKVHFYTAGNEREEGMYVASQLLKAYGEGKQWRDCAVLYRMNALSNQIEMALKSNSIPYRVVGGFRFFERAEIKDMLSYLCVIHNPRDDLRLLRVVNNPPRGIGAKTMETARTIAVQEGRSLWDILTNAAQIPALQRAAPKFQKFVDLIQAMQRLAQEADLPEFYETLIQESGYAAMLSEKKDNESKSRLENIHELSSSISGYLENAEEPTLGGFLDEVALYTDLDSVEDGDNCVTLMTMHAAKGLEFPIVFSVGMEEGVFPGYRAIGEEEELEEERRLCYVALTRAKERLYLTCAAQRMLFGRTSANLPSRFVQEIPPEHLQAGGRVRQPRREIIQDNDWSTEERFSQLRQPVSRSQMPRPSGTRAAPAAYRQPAPKAKPLMQLRKGEVVRHAAFGTGMVLSIQPMGGDALIEVAFDNVGTKRMMLKAASQFMTKL